MVIFGAGCLEEQPIQNAPVISESENLVPAEEALKADPELIPASDVSMPCFQFKFREGFMTWLESYEKEDPFTSKQSAGIGLPEVPEAELINVLKESQSDDALQTSLCVIHKELASSLGR